MSTFHDHKFIFKMDWVSFRKELGLLERLSGEPVTALINDRIHHHVEHKCKGNFENPYLEPLKQVLFEWQQSF